MSYHSKRQHWKPSTTAQLSLPLEVERVGPAQDARWREEWDRRVASLETDVVDGVFCPAIDGDGTVVPRRQASRRRSSQLHEERVPASLFSRDTSGRTYRTTYTRLRDRGHLYCSLITIVDGDAETPFALSHVSRRGDEWTSMRFQHRVGGRVERELVVVNNEVDAGSLRGAGNEQGITVARDGDCWVATFTWSEASKETVRRAGFRFSPVERRWTTADRRVAARLEATIRSGRR